MSLLVQLVKIFAPFVMQAAETAIERVSKHVEPRRAHYYRSTRNNDGTWLNDDFCQYCGRVDPTHRIYTEPPCSHVFRG